jgi:hypothetical protein
MGDAVMKKGILFMLLCVMHIGISAQEKSPGLVLIQRQRTTLYEDFFIHLNKTFFPHYPLNIVSVCTIVLTAPDHNEETRAPVIVKNKNNYEGLEFWTGLGLYIFMDDGRQVDRILEAGSRVTENNRKYEKHGFFEL